MSATNAQTADIIGSGKGAQGWFPLGQASISYGKPAHASLDAAVAIDFANEARGPDSRVAVELSLESALTLVGKIHTILGISQAHQGPVEPEMCSDVIETADIVGSGYGSQGWYDLKKANVYFDQPFHARMELALIVDFQNEEQGAGGRLAVELTADSAREVTRSIQAALEGSA